MKIGIVSDTKHEYGFFWGEDCYKKLKEHGYSATDYQDMAPDSSFVYNLPWDEVEKELLYEKKLADEAGIEIAQVHGPWRFPPKDSTAELRAERLEVMKKSIRATAILGSKYWIVHPIMPYGVEDIGTGTEQETFDLNVEFMSKLLDTARECGVTICYENMPFLNFSLSKPADILKVVKTINDDNFKVCLDTGHVGAFESISAGDAVRELGNELKTLHVHDTKQNKDLHLWPYFGIIDWDDFAKALKEINYSGVFSLETSPPVKAPKYLYEEMGEKLIKIAKEIAGKI